MKTFKSQKEEYFKKYKNPLSREAVIQGKLLSVKQSLFELAEIGEDYSVFQNAQITHKNLKKALKLLEGLR